jgi:carbamate kinase
MEKPYNSSHLLVNETFIVDHDVNDRWLQWFTENYLAALFRTENVKNIVFSRIVEEYNPDGNSYAIQFQTESKYVGHIYDSTELKELRNEMYSEFRGYIASFETKMEILKTD